MTEDDDNVLADVVAETEAVFAVVVERAREAVLMKAVLFILRFIGRVFEQKAVVRCIERA